MCVVDSQDRYDAAVANGTGDEEAKAAVPWKGERVDECEDRRGDDVTHRQGQLQPTKHRTW